MIIIGCCFEPASLSENFSRARRDLRFRPKADGKRFPSPSTRAGRSFTPIRAGSRIRWKPPRRSRRSWRSRSPNFWPNSPPRTTPTCRSRTWCRRKRSAGSLARPGGIEFAESRAVLSGGLGLRARHRLRRFGFRRGARRPLRHRGILERRADRSPGHLETEKDPVGRWIGVPSATSFRRSTGGDIADHRPQYPVHGLHQAQGGGPASRRFRRRRVILEPKTGAVMALCGMPDFDPNAYSEVSDMSVYNNPAAFYVYEPGSIMKPVTMRRPSTPASFCRTRPMRTKDRCASGNTPSATRTARRTVCRP